MPKPCAVASDRAALGATDADLMGAREPALNPRNLAQAISGSATPGRWIPTDAGHGQQRSDPYTTAFQQSQQSQQSQQQLAQQQLLHLQRRASAEGGPPRERSPPIPVPLVKKKRT